MNLIEKITDFLKSIARLLFNVYVIVFLLALILGVAIYRLKPMVISPKPEGPSNEALITQKQDQLKTVTAHLKNARENGNLENILNFELDSVRIEQEIYDLRERDASEPTK